MAIHFSGESQRHRRGWRYTAAILAARAVPASVCRLRRFVIMGRDEVSRRRIDNAPQALADPGRAPQGSNPPSSPAGPAQVAPIRIANTEVDIQAAESLTGYHRRLAGKTPAAVPHVVVAEREGVIVGACWFTDVPFVEHEMRLVWNPVAGQRWVFSSYVAKPWRGQGLYRQLMHLVATIGPGPADPATAPRDMFDRPRELLLSINVANRRSVDVHRRLGFVERGTALGFHLLGRAALWGPLSRDGDVYVDHKRYLRWSLPPNDWQTSETPIS